MMLYRSVPRYTGLYHDVIQVCTAQAKLTENETEKEEMGDYL